MERTSYRPIVWLLASLVLGTIVCVQQCGTAAASSRAADSLATETDSGNSDLYVLRARISARACAAAQW